MKLRIRDMREDRDLSQCDIAAYLMCDQSSYSRYERQERSIPLDYVIKLAAYYHTSVDYLAGLTDDPRPHSKSK